MKAGVENTKTLDDASSKLREVEEDVVGGEEQKSTSLYLALVTIWNTYDLIPLLVQKSNTCDKSRQKWRSIEDLFKDSDMQHHLFE